MSKPRHRGTIHVFDQEPKKGGNGWLWVIGIAVFLIILAAA